MERSEALAAVIGIMRDRLAGNPIPAFGSPGRNAEADALGCLADHFDAPTMQEFGVAAFRVLCSSFRATLHAELTVLDARMSALKARQAKGGE